MNTIETSTLVYWADLLKQIHPNVPQGVIDHALKQYSQNPVVFDQVVQEFKANPVEAQVRDIKGEYNTTYSGNDIPWGEAPQLEIEQE
tara:strand:+ start:484 stop:747 length:264 start_codon:yes stop_codon:yes gene_type:complete